MTPDNISLVHLKAILIAFALSTMSLASSQAVKPEEIDKLFENWSKTSSPGCSVAVSQNGKLVYSKGFGMANLEDGITIQPRTIFHVASVSKQFTAFAVHLLAKDGKLGLDDNVRKYIPELHQFNKIITIRHLLYHTSGLRDQWELLVLSGWRIDDVITEEDILDRLWKQRELNFDPGSQFSYSNSGYTLLGLIVKRVSGKSLREFCKERIFDPLGMKSTHFHDDYTEVVPDRAQSYFTKGSGFGNSVLSYSNVGATSLFTTAEDLTKWGQNFLKPVVGDASLLKAVEERRTLSGGGSTNYASGVIIGNINGFRTVEHAGGDAGFRTQFVTVPDQNLTVVVLSNLAEFDPVGSAANVARLFLPVAKISAQTQSFTQVKVDEATLKKYAGDYRLGPDFFRSISVEGGKIFVSAAGQARSELTPISESSFRVSDSVTYSFALLPDKTGYEVTRADGVSRLTGRVFKPSKPSFAELREYEGSYFSSELETFYTFHVEGDKLRCRFIKNGFIGDPLDKDEFKGDGLRIEFTRDAKKGITGFLLSTDRIKNLRFFRASPPTEGK